MYIHFHAHQSGYHKSIFRAHELSNCLHPTKKVLTLCHFLTTNNYKLLSDVPIPWSKASCNISWYGAHLTITMNVHL